MKPAETGAFKQLKKRFMGAIIVPPSPPLKGFVGVGADSDFPLTTVRISGNVHDVLTDCLVVSFNDWREA